MAQIEAKSWGAGLSVPEGRCAVNLDDSALRMLEPAQHRQNLAQSSFHSFKYHFKPESIDVRKPGKVQPANPPRVVQDGVALDVEQLGSNNDDKHLFTAIEQGTKELDVFMVFDPTTGSFTMYEADSYVLLTYDRAASKAASRARSRASPASQPLAMPATTAPPPKPAALTPVTLPVAAPAETLIPSPSTKRAPVPKAKTKTRPRPKPVPVKLPTPPPQIISGETEDGEVEFEPVAVPEPVGLAMDIDSEQTQNIVENSETADADADGILPWDAVPTTTHWRAGGTTSTFNATDGPEEEVFHFGGSLTKEQPRKGQSKPGRAGGIVFPKAGRGRDPPPRAPPPPPPVQHQDPDDEEMDDMDEVVLPGMESHTGDLEDEIMKQMQGESSDEDEDEDGSEDDEDDEDDGFDVQAFEQALAQGMTEGDEVSDDEDGSSSEEDD
ncbi:hypothetical protein BDV93DRAFT_519522 [Ceratobasidium sp. AG-I]|nr:hypothetical protein BDV93DRAFT_519522 [Ceratobasidium sp. AG-I]